MTPASRWRLSNKHFSRKCFEGFLVGVGTAALQLLTSLVVFGWYWSIMHGVHFIQKANEFAKKVKENEEQVIM